MFSTLVPRILICALQPVWNLHFRVDRGCRREYPDGSKVNQKAFRVFRNRVFLRLNAILNTSHSFRLGKVFRVLLGLLRDVLDAFQQPRSSVILWSDLVR